jgi:putative tryptophan/tyrosine transport system substrate-binding protein
MRDHGYVEGRNLAVEYRLTDQGAPRLREFAAELVHLPVDVIVASAFAALPAKQATETDPIVFSGGVDPVAAGLVDGLSHPGHNVTGLPSQLQDSPLIGKRLELLKLTAPGLARVAVLSDANSAAIHRRILPAS